MSAASINTKMEEAAAAIEAGDWDTAFIKATAAWVLLIALPDSQKGDKELEWDRDTLKDLLDTIKSERASASTAAQAGGPIQRTKIHYTGATS